MNRSESIVNLAAALAKAQGAIENASKDSSNPHFNKKYADLASVWNACRGPLSANGLSVIQAPTCDGATVTVETMLLHESGEFISEVLTLPVLQVTAQGVGGALTYTRRYALSALVGIAPDDDDDGNAATGAPQGRQESRRQEPQRTPPAVPAQPVSRPAARASASEVKGAEPKRVNPSALEPTPERINTDFRTDKTPPPPPSDDPGPAGAQSTAATEPRVVMDPANDVPKSDTLLALKSAINAYKAGGKSMDDLKAFAATATRGLTGDGSGLTGAQIQKSEQASQMLIAALAVAS